MVLEFLLELDVVCWVDGACLALTMIQSSLSDEGNDIVILLFLYRSERLELANDGLDERFVALEGMLCTIDVWR